MKKLPMTLVERAKLLENGEIGLDRWGNEVLIGLTSDESQRHLQYVHSRMRPKARHEKTDARYLRDRHKRAMLFWKAAQEEPDKSTKEMSAEEAFETGGGAWKAYAGVDQISDFREMIRSVPAAVRMAALNGWLVAFDDEAERLKSS
jgi:hypothetical protein